MGKLQTAGYTARSQFFDFTCHHLACDTFAERNFVADPLVDPAVVPDAGAGGGGGLHDGYEAVAS